MYRCQVTGKFSKLGEKLHKITVQSRERIYTRWVRNDDKSEGIDRTLVVNESADRKWLEVFVAKGWEIVRELNASQEGAALWASWTPEEREMFLKDMN